MAHLALTNPINESEEGNSVYAGYADGYSRRVIFVQHAGGVVNGEWILKSFALINQLIPEAALHHSQPVHVVIDYTDSKSVDFSAMKLDADQRVIDLLAQSQLGF